jgi:ribose transport system permease protein
LEKSARPSTIAEEFSQNLRSQNAKNKVIGIAPIIVLVVLMVFFVIVQPTFLSFDNIRALLNQLAIPLILALGLTFVVIMGSIDLSLEGVMGFSAALISILVASDKFPEPDLSWGGLVISVLACGAFGLLSGFIHVKAKLPSFMVTLAISNVAAGLGMLSYQGVPAFIKFDGLKDLVNGDIGGIIPFTFLVGAAVFLVMLIIQKYTSFGRYIYAIGDNEMIPRVSGVNVDRVKIMAFVLAGLCIGIAGVLSCGKLGRGTILSGQNQLFPALTAVVVGGTALSGGKGGMVNSLIGALIVTVLQNGLILMGVEPTIQTGIQGAIILAAVAVTVYRGRRVITK